MVVQTKFEIKQLYQQQLQNNTDKHVSCYSLYVRCELSDIDGTVNAFKGNYKYC